jgi:hypothetical protein
VTACVAVRGGGRQDQQRVVTELRERLAAVEAEAADPSGAEEVGARTHRFRTGLACSAAGGVGLGLVGCVLMDATPSVRRCTVRGG